MRRRNITTRYNRLMGLLLRAAAVAAAIAAGGACKDKGGGTSATDAVAKMTSFKTAMCACTDAACAKKVSDEMAAWGREQPANNPAMSADDQKRANAIGRELGDCLLRVMAKRDAGSAAIGSAAAASPPPNPPPPPTGSGAAPSGLPKECDEYRALVTRLQTCEGMAKQARETLIKGYEEAATRWAMLAEESRESLAAACAGGGEAVMAAAKTQCGW